MVALTYSEVRLRRPIIRLCFILNAEYNDLGSLAEIFVPMLYKMALVKNKGANLSYFIEKTIW